MITFSYWKPESSFTFVHANGKDKETVTFVPYLSMNDFAGLTPALLAGKIRASAFANRERPLRVSSDSSPGGIRYARVGQNLQHTPCAAVKRQLCDRQVALAAGACHNASPLVDPPKTPE
jgi:hypothetical protein